MVVAGEVVDIEEMKAMLTVICLIGVFFVFWMAAGIKKDGTKIQEEYADSPYEVAAGCGKAVVNITLVVFVIAVVFILLSSAADHP